jgi:dTDP-glucose 4,6-dehydratase
VLKLLGKPESLITFVPDRLGHVRRHAVSIAKIFHRLHWEPKVSFEQGIKETINWYRNMLDFSHGEV